MMQKINPSKLIVSIVLWGLLAFLIFYQLDTYPTPWFDEGFHLLAAEKLALSGEYRFGPAVGPTVFYPVAAAFRLFGIGLVQARLVMVGYLIVFLIAFYKLILRFGNQKLAFITIFLLISSPGSNLFYYGRQVLGEVPAATYLLLGILFWLHALDQPPSKKRWLNLGLAGVWMGLAILTKNQFSLFLPAWALIWLFDRFYHHQTKISDFALPSITLFVIIISWFLIQRFLLTGGEKLATYNVEEWQGALQRGILVFSPSRALDSVRYLTSQDAFYGLVLPGLFFAFFLGLQRNKNGLQYSFLGIITGIWLTWFVILSVGWPRYIFLPVSLSSIFIAKLFYELTDGYRFSIKQFSFRMIRDGDWDYIAIRQMTLVVFLAVIILRPLSARFTEVIGKGNETPYQMAAYISDNLPEGTVLETYEPEVCFLAQIKCHFPPSEILTLAIRYVWYGDTPPSQYYKRSDSPYLLMGTYGKWCSIYDANDVKQNYTLIKSLGEYDLYQLNPSP
jgi:hypothetical protein